MLRDGELRKIKVRGSMRIPGNDIAFLLGDTGDELCRPPGKDRLPIEGALEASQVEGIADEEEDF